MPPKLKAGSQRDVCAPVFLVAKTWKQSKNPLTVE